MSSPEAQLLGRFVSAFKRGLEREVAAMRGSAGTFELALARGEELGGLRYGFELLEETDRLAAGGEHTLRTSRGEQRVTIERCDELRVVVIAEQPIDLTADRVTLVVAPWFLYERLLQALDEIDIERHAVERALTLFGRRPHRRAASALRGAHDALNASQRAAVQLCSDSDLAFVWGPPGTGKTVTLTHVIEELLAQGKRILLASTTNAAIDQVLAKLAARPWFLAAAEAGTLVRLGRSEHETFGAELAEVVGRLQGKHRAALDHLRARIADAEQQGRYGDALLAELAPAAAPQQSLFAGPSSRLGRAALSRIFSPGLAEAVAMRPPQEQMAVIERRLARLARLRALAKERVARHTAALREVEARVIADARVVMCTLTNAYLSPLMRPLRFDVLIAEEASMATLPSLFYAACLCQEKAIMVGDPRQLPPIVHSREERVQRAIGRSVFEVTIPDPARSEVVAMLDVQYRMHPAIGALVGRLFYGGRLMHGGETAGADVIAARAPYPGMPLIVVDTAGATTCQRAAKGASRVNAASAEIAAELASEAVAAGTGAVAVITPYAAQARDIRRRLAARRIADAALCSTIHRFQGRECDVVIIDLVDAAPMPPGLLLAGDQASSDACNLLNVSLSRARGKLVIIADVGYFEARAPGSVVAAILREATGAGFHARPAHTAATGPGRG
ncbi:MAG TPA: AAA domain-containing protein [Kofleriaceae bacterium]|nr:AAA domain-containing protein [Kofleriaceae bacterium]